MPIRIYLCPRSTSAHQNLLLYPRIVSAPQNLFLFISIYFYSLTAVLVHQNRLLFLKICFCFSRSQDPFRTSRSTSAPQLTRDCRRTGVRGIGGGKPGSRGEDSMDSCLERRAGSEAECLRARSEPLPSLPSASVSAVRLAIRSGPSGCAICASAASSPRCDWLSCTPTHTHTITPTPRHHTHTQSSHPQHFHHLHNTSITTTPLLSHLQYFHHNHTTSVTPTILPSQPHHFHHTYNTSITSAPLPSHLAPATTPTHPPFVCVCVRVCRFAFMYMCPRVCVCVFCFADVSCLR